MVQWSVYLNCNINVEVKVRDGLIMNSTSTIKREKTTKGKKIMHSALKFFLVCFLSLGILVSTAVIFVFYSPYTKFKELFVTTAMTTLSHQYLAHIFVSDEEIQRIMDKNKIEEPKENTNVNEIKPVPSPADEIQLFPIGGLKYKGYMLVVKDPARVVIGTTSKLRKAGMKVADIVEKYNAVSGINAGGFSDDEGKGTGGTPEGILIENYKLLFTDTDYKHSVIGFDSNNKLVLGNYTTKQLKSVDLRDAVSFKPFLIINGKPTIKTGDGGWGIAPRTVIGQRTDGSVLMLVIDGRQIGSIGATLKDAQDIMMDFGAHNAANLDGGSSTTLYHEGKLINNPCSKGGPRYVPSAFIIKK